MYGFTQGKIYRIHSISKKKLGSYSLDSFHVVNDYGNKVNVFSRLFRDFNTKEYREEQLSKIGL